MFTHRGKAWGQGYLFMHTHETQLTLNGDDELWNNRQYFGPSVFQHVMYTLPGKELIWMCGLTQAIEEERQVVMVVQLLYFHLCT